MKVNYTQIAKDMGINRATIYAWIKREGIDKNTVTEQQIRKRFADTASAKLKTLEAFRKATPLKVDKQHAKMLTIDEVSTIKQRLENAKDQYNFNEKLMVKFQEEINTYQEQNGTTMMTSHSNAMTLIPHVKQLEAYAKLNITLSKHISELELLLKLGEEIEDDPYG